MSKKSLVHVKLFSISRENDDYLAFIGLFPRLHGEEDDTILEAYMQWWFKKNEGIRIEKISPPLWAENHLFCYVWYYK